MSPLQSLPKIDSSLLETGVPPLGGMLQPVIFADRNVDAKHMTPKERAPVLPVLEIGTGALIFQYRQLFVAC